MKSTILVALVSGLALTALTATPSRAVFKPGFGGFGLHPFPFHGLGFGRGFAHRRSSQFPWYGVAGYDPYLNYAPLDTGDGNTIIKILPPPEPPHALTCKHSEETKAVPSEDGGVKQIVVTRC